MMAVIWTVEQSTRAGFAILTGECDRLGTLSYAIDESGETSEWEASDEWETESAGDGYPSAPQEIEKEAIEIAKATREQDEES